MIVGSDHVNSQHDPEALPPAHPHLVEYLRSVFPVVLPEQEASAEEALKQVSSMRGEQRVIDLIANLVENNGLAALSNNSPQGEAREYQPTKSESPDPLRARGRSRR